LSAREKIEKKAEELKKRNKEVWSQINMRHIVRRNRKKAVLGLICLLLIGVVVVRRDYVWTLLTVYTPRSVKGFIDILPTPEGQALLLIGVMVSTLIAGGAAFLSTGFAGRSSASGVSFLTRPRSTWAIHRR
jgi:hypothetical protein